MNTTPTSRLAGYAALTERLSLSVVPNWHESRVALQGGRRVELEGSTVRETYPPPYWPGEELADHLEFALKYDGTNLAVLKRVFEAVGPSEMAAYVRSKPTGKYARRAWFLYEFLTGRRLPLADLTKGSYVDLVQPDGYFTVAPARRVRRQRINDNLLGSAGFCPMVRRTPALQRFVDANLDRRCQTVMSEHPPDLIRRARSYLYTKETKSSFEIERIDPSPSRTERFISLLERAQRDDFCEKSRLVELQNRIVERRFAEEGYRTGQNYVGESLGWRRERVHFACPKPEDLPNLMSGLIAAHERMGAGGVHPVVHAAVVGYGFVFLHPFEDGNGRIHRFLIHNALARRGFTPQGVIFPISAVMLKSPAEYDLSLESFSRPLMQLVEYTLNAEGQMKVLNDTADWYRFIDMTEQVEALFALIAKTIETELSEELNFLANYDRARSEIQAVVDMPDRKVDLFIRLCLQNQGRLSDRKRRTHFQVLTDSEVGRMEEAVQSVYQLDAT